MRKERKLLPNPMNSPIRQGIPVIGETGSLANKFVETMLQGFPAIHCFVEFSRHELIRLEMVPRHV